MSETMLALVKLINAPERYTGDAAADARAEQQDNSDALPTMVGLIWKKVPAYSFMPLVWRQVRGGLIFPTVDEIRDDDEVLVKPLPSALELLETKGAMDGMLPVESLKRLCVVLQAAEKPPVGDMEAAALEAFAPYFLLALLEPTMSQREEEDAAAEARPEPEKGDALCVPIPRTQSGLDGVWNGPCAVLAPDPDDLSPLFSSAKVLASVTMAPALLNKGVSLEKIPSNAAMRVFFVGWHTFDAVATSVTIGAPTSEQ
jgi:hypothetical protein